MSPRRMSETHLPVEVCNVIVRPFATTTPEKVRVDPFRRSIAVYVPSSLMTRVALPNALPPLASEPTGACATCHVPTRSLGRADGRHIRFRRLGDAVALRVRGTIRERDQRDARN